MSRTWRAWKSRSRRWRTDVQTQQAGRCRPACAILFEVRTPTLVSGGLRLVLLRLVGGIEGVLEGDEVFARLQRVEDSLLSLELLSGVVGGLDGQADAPVALVNLDDARGDFLADQIGRAH